MRLKVLQIAPIFLFLVSILMIAGAPTAFAAPHDWQIGFQDAASPVAEHIHGFHNMMMVIITVITLFVMALLLYVMVRFNAKANPVPSKNAHNTMLEVVWTLVPVIILVIIIIPSLKLLYFGDRTVDSEMTLKVTGYQWYWGYEYPDQGGINFTANMIPSDEIDPAKGQVRLLSTDNPIVLPVDTNIQILVTASDVLHSFTVPALGFKTDAVPGKMNETWVRITKPGVYYGQCSELCGTNHAFMPIEFRAVSKEEFSAWSAKAKDDLEGAYKLLQPVQTAAVTE